MCRHYVVLFPSTFYYPYTGKVHVHLMDLDAPVRVSLHLESSHRVPDVVLEEQGSGVLQLDWPRFLNISAGHDEFYETAELQLSIQGGSLQVFRKKSVLLEPMELGVLFQTDKDSYEPGQTVKLRIVCLDHNLMPSNKELPLVAIKDPNFEPVKTWQKVRPLQGIVELSYLLPSDSELGTYTISVGRRSREFSVEKQGLPHFAVLLQLPRSVTVEDTKIPVGVCGRHPPTSSSLDRNPSGKPFRGKAEAKLCQYRRLPEGATSICAVFRGQTGRDSCFFTEVPTAPFDLSSPHSKQHLYAFGWLQQQGTGLQHTAIQTCKIVKETATISFQSSEFYKPGVPYTATMMLKGPKGSVLRGQEFFLVINNVTGVLGMQSLLTDELGRASVQLDTSGWSDKITLHGAFKDDPPAAEPEILGQSYYQSVVHHLYPTSSGGRSFLRIHRVAKELPCGQPLQLEVDYLLEQEAVGMELHSLDVVFLVLAKGAIVTVLRKELTAEPGLRGSFSLELPISLQLAPRFRVLGYMVLPHGEMVADSTKFNVTKCFPSQVNLSFSEQRAVVGSQLHLKLQAAPGSLCAIYSLDQRTQPSGSKAKLNPDLVYATIPRFYPDTHPFAAGENDLPLCPQSGFWEPIVSLPSTSCFEVPGKDSWKRCLHNLVPRSAEVPGSATLLKDSRLKIITNTHLGCASKGWYQTFESSLFTKGENLEDIEQAGVLQDTGMQSNWLRTWLWELVPVGESGSAELAVTVPDTITTWEAGMLCTSALGLGLAPATTLAAFKPFFVELALPHSVVHQEAFTLVATVFSSLQQCLRVQVTLVAPVELEMLAGTSRSSRGCVCPEGPRTFRWSLRATSLGQAIVTVTARTLPSGKLCGTQVPAVLSQEQVDTDTRLLVVQPPTSK
ncbi:alpha-2-macroglobulin-like protein 1 [Pogoniulus pusillus]|uniref:alpha-2-macroglobulin-like protein 1 n=1 Tax=Pogoniulus pusillus TaxID=488313 RepID=UPI0030B942F4